MVGGLRAVRRPVLHIGLRGEPGPGKGRKNQLSSHSKDFMTQRHSEGEGG